MLQLFFFWGGGEEWGGCSRISIREKDDDYHIV